MKKIFYLVALGIVFSSCSDKLTESKVKELVKECQAKSPKIETKKIDIGENSSISKDLPKLAEKGLLKIEEFENKSPLGIVFGKKYVVSLTEKAKPFVVNQTSYSAEVKLYTYEIDQVGSIHEIPAYNAAEVEITYKKVDKTPFYDVLETNKTDVEKTKITLGKTENKGWQYCRE